MDIPAVVAGDYKPTAADAKNGERMFFAVTTDMSGDLDCILNRNAYTKDFPRATAVERLADNDRDRMCYGGDKVTNFDVGESESLSISGYPAGRCAASYNDSSDKHPGQVAAVMSVAHPDGLYMLSCTVYADNDQEAIAHWMSRWQDIVHHIQESMKFRGK